MPHSVEITPAKPGEVKALAKLWHASWTFAHAHLVGPALIEVRSVGAFELRISKLLGETLVARIDDTPIGFSVTKEDELYQFFMSDEGRGTGVAAQLMQATEHKMVKTGIKQAHLHCLIGNDRAMAFYEKMGWLCGGILPVTLRAKDLAFEVAYQKFTKNLT